MARTNRPTDHTENVVQGDELVGADELAGADELDDAAPRPPIEATIISGPAVSGAEIARRDGSGMEVEGYVAANHPAMIALNTWLTDHHAVGNDADMAVAEIIAQVLSANSLAEVLADVRAVGMRDLMGVPIRIHNAKPLKSSYESNAAWFFYCDVEKIETGERIGVTSGATTVVAQLVRNAMLDLYPFDCVVIKATKKPTANGYWPYKLTEYVPPTAG